MPGTTVGEPSLVAWAVLPANAATNAHAQSQAGIDCVKTASAGQWHCLLTGALLVCSGNNPTGAIFVSPGVPSDSNNGVSVAIGDLGAGNFEITVRREDTGFGDPTQSATLFVWALPTLR